jgi:membrane-bound ClpP family serine protease
MPLSNEERKQLEEMERELNVEEPRLARKLLAGSLGPSLAAPAVFGILTMVVGFLVLILGIALQFTVIGVTGFVLMGAGAYWLVSSQSPGGRSW